MKPNERIPAKCPVCENKLAMYIGKFGNFLGCNGYSIHYSPPVLINLIKWIIY